MENTLAKSLSVSNVCILFTSQHAPILKSVFWLELHKVLITKLNKILQVIFSPYCETLEQSLAEFN